MRSVDCCEVQAQCYIKNRLTYMPKKKLALTKHAVFRLLSSAVNSHFIFLSTHSDLLIVFLSSLNHRQFKFMHVVSGLL